MNNDYLSEMFEYDSTVNASVLDLLRSLPSIDDRTMSIFTHLLTAKKVWLTRLRSQDSSRLQIWPALDLNECGTLIEENRIGYKDYLRDVTEEQLEENIRYKNSNGTEYENSVLDVLMHVLIHSGYHRGQIAKAVRESGEEPIISDYIFYIRKPI
jgi:uncharacterized damage-inducible protein DinB